MSEVTPRTTEIQTMIDRATSIGQPSRLLARLYQVDPDVLTLQPREWLAGQGRRQTAIRIPDGETTGAAVTVTGDGAQLIDVGIYSDSDCTGVVVGSASIDPSGCVIDVYVEQLAVGVSILGLGKDNEIRVHVGAGVTTPVSIDAAVDVTGNTVTVIDEATGVATVYAQADALVTTPAQIGMRVNAPAFDNSAPLNSYFASDWRKYGPTLEHPDGVFFFADTAEVGGTLAGFSVSGVGGETDVWGSTRFDAGANERVGPATVWAWTGPIDRPMLRVKNLGFHWGPRGAITAQGRWDADDLKVRRFTPYDSESVQYPIRAIDAATGLVVPMGGNYAVDERCLSFLEVPSDPVSSNGKLYFPNGLAPYCFRTAISVPDAAANGHGDESEIRGRFAPWFCDVGLHVAELQGLGWKFDTVIQSATSIGFLYDDGGDLQVKKLLAGGAHVHCGLYLRGGAMPEDVFHFGHVQLDNNQLLAGDADPLTTPGAPYYCFVIVNPTTGFVPATVVVDSMTIHSLRADATWFRPLAWVKNGYGAVILRNVKNSYPGMLHAEGGTTALNELFLCDAHQVARGSITGDRVELFDDFSTGYVRALFRNCYERDGSTGGIYATAVNAGKIYDDQILNVVELKLVTADYTVDADDRAVRGNCTSGAITVTLPSVAGQDGRLVAVKKIDGTANKMNVQGTGGQNVGGVALYDQIDTRFERRTFVADEANSEWDVKWQ